MAHQFYSKIVTDHIARMPTDRNHKILSKFPLQFVQVTKPQSFPFYSKYFIDSQYKSLFLELLSLISGQPSTNRIETNLERMLKESRASSGVELRIDHVDVKRIRVIDQVLIKGVFMHRHLNMRSNCYSFEKKENKNKADQYVYRIRSKLQREEDIGEWNLKKKMYESEENRFYEFYMDGFENFLKTESFIRRILAVYVQISGEIRSPQGIVVKLPYSPEQPISTHLMQIQSPNIQGVDRGSRLVASDIDFSMKGNPYVK